MTRFRFYSVVNVPMDAQFWAAVACGVVLGWTPPLVVL